MDTMAPKLELHAVFCRNVRARIAALGWTQTYFGDQLGVNRSVVSQLLSGRYAPTLTLIAKIAEVLGVSGAELLDESSSLAETTNSQ